MADNGISGLDLFDDLINELSELEPTEQDQRRALLMMNDVIRKSTKEEAPEQYGDLKKSIKTKVRNGSTGIEGVVYATDISATMTNWGTSKDKSHVGWWERGVENGLEEAVEEARKVLKL